MRNMILCLFALSIYGSASAYSIAEKREIKRNGREFSEKLAELNTACNAKITGAFDLKSEPTVASKRDSRPAGAGYQFCSSVLEGITRVCADEDAKSTIVEKIKSIKCKFSEGSAKRGKDHNGVPGGPEIVLNGTVLEITFDFTTSNITDTTHAFLMKSL